jgi:HEAT repeat protein
MEELVFLGEDAVPALLMGLKYPSGFADKRARVCETLGRIGAKNAAPALSATLRDPVLEVAAWANYALESVGDKETLPALARYQDRLRTLASLGQIPSTAGTPDSLIAQAARTRLLVGEPNAKHDLVRLLLSDDPLARAVAIDALEVKYDERHDYDPNAPVEQRRAAVMAWTQ